MSLIDKFFLYNMPPEDGDEQYHDDSASTSQSRAEELRRRLYQNYFTTSYGGAPPQTGSRGHHPQRNFLGGEFDDARNTAESEWIEGEENDDFEDDEDGEYDEYGQRSGSHDVDEEDALLMTETEKEQFAAQLSSLEQREGAAPHLFDKSEALRQHSKSAERTASGTMYERNFRWKQRLSESTDQLRGELSLEQARDCTFSPTINRKPVSRTSSDAQQNHETRVEPAAERLQKAVAAKNARLDELRRNAAEQELRSCTFRPRVVRSSWVQGVTPRYLDDTHGAAQKDEDHPALAQCSFTPKTNRRVVGGLSQQTSAYLAAPAHDRLSRDAATKIKKQRELETTVSTIGAATASSTPSTSARSKKLAPAASFFERMTQLEKKKAAHRIELEQELRATTPFKPVISVYKPAEKSDHTDKHPHYHRDCAVAAKSAEEECTGRPEINLASRQLPRTVDDLHNSLRVRRNKIKKLERHYKEEEMKEATFSPRVSRFSHETGGKLAEYLNKGVESYTLFVEMQKTMKEKKLQQLRVELESRDQHELTFRPEVHKAPPLIQEMAAEVRRAREVSQGALPSAGNGNKAIVTPFRF